MVKASEAVPKVKEARLWEPLCKYIRCHIRRGHMCEADLARFSQVADHVVFNGDMLGALGDSWGGNHVDSRLVVLVDR